MTIPNSVTSIGGFAFQSCKSLTSVNIPNSVTSIGEWAFDNCSNLESVTIPNSVTSIGEFAFNGCWNLESVTIPNSVTSIDDNAFSKGCTIICEKDSAADKYAKENGNEIIYFIYSEPDYLYKELDDGTVQIIQYTGKIAELTIPSKLAEKKVSGIGNGAFANMSDLTSVTIPKGVTSIGDSAFKYCEGLTSITIPDGVKSIGGDAFYWCTGLTSINIPDSVTSIGGNAFYNCSSLKSVTIPSGVTRISGGMFEECSGLESVTIPNSVTSIGDYAFHVCSKLKTITIPNSVTSIGETAFSSSGLTSVTIPSSITSISDRVFDGCQKLTSVTIPNSVTSIGYSAFSDCENLKSVTIPKSVTSIAGNAFGYAWAEKIDGFTIKGTKDSAAEKYAKDNGFDFVNINAPKITKQPANVTVAKAGDTATFSVTATGTGLKYEWYVKDPGGSWTKTGATSNKYSVSITAARNGRQVFCKVIDASGAFVKSNTVTAKYVEKLAITKQPTNITVAKAGDTASFSVTATGTGLKYEWYIKDIGGSWTKVGSTSNKYSVALKETRNGRQVFCKVIDSTGTFVKSDIVTATIKGTVVITKQPTNVTVSKAGNTASFTVTALGSNLKYEWYIKDPGGKWTKTGATSNKYSVSVTAARNGRQVFCKVIDSSTKNFAKSNTVTAKIK